MRCHLIIYCAAYFPLLAHCYLAYVGPKFPPTKGEVWPKPQHEVKRKMFYVLDNFDAFSITKPSHTCDILEKAITRLLHINLITKYKYVKKNKNPNENRSHNDVFYGGTYSRNKTEFRIELTKECEKYPYLDMNEEYNLTVDSSIVLSSASIWGILRGLETFNHLLYYSDDYSDIRINHTFIYDYPAYKYRGLLVDTGRHYLSIDTLHSMIDAMEMNKMNVLHWHIVDDQSFPYQSERFPALSKLGAYHSSMVYSKDDIQKIVEHARLAGIRVIPELDVPGLGPLDPTKKEAYVIIEELYREVREWFPDEYIHVGGDEVDLKCWTSNPLIQSYMEKNNLTPQNLHALFMNKVKMLLPPLTKSMVWQDVFDEGVPLLNKTIVQVWRYQWIEEMDKVLKAGHRVVFSSSWYLDYLKQGWDTFYRADPRQMVFKYNSNTMGLEDIMGGEACMWGEMVDDQNIATRTWPRASAVAERLWTGLDIETDIDPVTYQARCRIEEHTCRMIQRGVAAEPPNGPGFCIKL